MGIYCLGFFFLDWVFKNTSKCRVSWIFSLSTGVASQIIRKIAVLIPHLSVKVVSKFLSFGYWILCFRYVSYLNKRGSVHEYWDSCKAKCGNLWHNAICMNCQNYDTQATGIKLSRKFMNLQRHLHIQNDPIEAIRSD